MRTRLGNCFGLVCLAFFLGACATARDQGEASRNAAWLSGAKEPVDPNEQIAFDRVRNATLNPLLSLAGIHEKIDVDELKTTSYKKVVSNETHHVFTGTNGKDFSYRVRIIEKGTDRSPSLLMALLAHSVISTSVTVDRHSTPGDTP